MAAMQCRVILVLVSLSVTLLLVGITGAEYTNKFYIDENCGKNLTTDKITGEIHLTRGRGCAASQCQCAMGLEYTKDETKRLKVKFMQLDLGKDSHLKCLGTIHISTINGNERKSKTSKMCADIENGAETQADMNFIFFEVKLGNFAKPKISMFWTVFHEDVCAKGEFMCAEKPMPCVAESLVCDGYDNCGDNSDEAILDRKCVSGAIGVTSSTYQLSVITLAAILLLKLFS